MSTVHSESDFTFKDAIKLTGVLAGIGFGVGVVFGVCILLVQQENADIRAQRQKELRVAAAKARAARQAKHDSIVPYYEAARNSALLRGMLPNCKDSQK